MSPSLQAIVSALTVVSMIVGSYIFLDGRFAEEDDLASLSRNVDRVETRLDNKIIGDQIQQLQQRIWAMDERLREHPDEAGTRSELRRLRARKNKLEQRQRILTEKLEGGQTTGVPSSTSATSILFERLNLAPDSLFRSQLLTTYPPSQQIDDVSQYQTPPMPRRP